MSGTASELDDGRDDPRRARSRVGLLLLLLLVVLAAVAWWNWDRIAFSMAGRFGFGSGSGAYNAGVPSYSQAQGAQDAPRAEVMTNRSHDYETCMETLRLRRVDYERANDTCRKMVQGLYGR